MVYPRRLILIGYWDGPQNDSSWPRPEDFVDNNWDSEERDLVVSYLKTGLIARAYMGYSRCRVCGKENGDLELSDGVFVWPDGLAHYVEMHDVRPPTRFVQHVLDMMDGIEGAERDELWWRQYSSAPQKPRSPW